MSDPRGAAGDARFVAALRDASAPPPPEIGTAQKRRFDIYRNNVAAGLVDAMRASFPAVERLVGDEFFSALARAYLASDPPRSPLLFEAGARFGAFIDGFPPVASLPYLGDVARLEWARLEAYHAADAEPLTIAALAEIPADALAETRFALHPSLRLVTSRWPVVSLWAASTDQGAAEAVDMRRAEDAAVIRPGLDLDTRLLPAGGHGFLAALAAGETLGGAAEAAAAAENAAELAIHLQGMFEIGAVTAITRASLPTRGT